MTDDEITFEKQKANLIIDCADDNFEHMIYEELSSGKYKTIEEVDAFVDKELKDHLTRRKLIKEYFNNKIYS